MLDNLKCQIHLPFFMEVIATKVFNFGIAKISVTTEITEIREIRLKFRRNFFRD